MCVRRMENGKRNIYLKGIVTNMIKLGTKHLKDLGLRKAFLSYTYTDIINMYGRAGYKVSMEYYMGEKAIESSDTEALI